LFDHAQSSFDFLLFRGGDNSGFRQRSRVSNRAGYVMRVKPVVEGNRLGVALCNFAAAF